MKKARPEYDVALSFAGEDRPYVKRCAEALRSAGIKVFFDEFEQSKLWGKDLYDYLRDIYRSKARFCVMFVSKHYARKRWTTHERQSAQARALEENAEYILPVRFDDTPVPGLNSNVAYLDLRNVEPEQLASMIAGKLGVSPLRTITEMASTIKALRRALEKQNSDPDFSADDPLRHRVCPGCGSDNLKRVVHYDPRQPDLVVADVSCSLCKWAESAFTSTDYDLIKRKYPGISRF